MWDLKSLMERSSLVYGLVLGLWVTICSLALVFTAGKPESRTVAGVWVGPLAVGLGYGALCAVVREADRRKRRRWRRY